MNKLETGTSLNQIGTLRWAKDTWWNSYLNSICIVIRLFGPTYSVLQTIVKEGTSCAQYRDASMAYNALTSYKFVFYLAHD